MFKKICGIIFNRILPVAFVVLGLPALFYGMWFQTEGFTLYYTYGVTPWDTCVLIAVVCFVVGCFIMNYFKKQSESGKTGKGAIRIQDLKAMIRGYVVCGYLCWGILWIAFTVLYFYLGIAGMSLCLGAVAYYLVWLYRVEKAAKEEKKA